MPIQPINQVAQAVTDANGAVTFTFNPVPPGIAWTGTVAVTGSKLIGTFTATIRTITWGVWAGSTPFGPIQALGNEVLVVTGTGADKNATLTATWLGVSEYADLVEPAAPSPLSVSALLAQFLSADVVLDNATATSQAIFSANYTIPAGAYEEVMVQISNQGYSGVFGGSPSELLIKDSAAGNIQIWPDSFSQTFTSGGFSGGAPIPNNALVVAPIPPQITTLFVEFYNSNTQPAKIAVIGRPRLSLIRTDAVRPPYVRSAGPKNVTRATTNQTGGVTLLAAPSASNGKWGASYLLYTAQLRVDGYGVTAQIRDTGPTNNVILEAVGPSIVAVNFGGFQVDQHARDALASAPVGLELRTFSGTGVSVAVPLVSAIVTWDMVPVVPSEVFI